MEALNLDDVREYVNEHIVDFHRRRIQYRIPLHFDKDEKSYLKDKVFKRRWVR